MAQCRNCGAPGFTGKCGHCDDVDLELLKLVLAKQTAELQLAAARAKNARVLCQCELCGRYVDRVNSFDVCATCDRECAEENAREEDALAMRRAVRDGIREGFAPPKTWLERVFG